MLGQALGADYWVGNGHKWLYRYSTPISLTYVFVCQMDVSDYVVVV